LNTVSSASDGASPVLAVTIRSNPGNRRTTSAGSEPEFRWQQLERGGRLHGFAGAGGERLGETLSASMIALIRSPAVSSYDRSWPDARDSSLRRRLQERILRIHQQGAHGEDPGAHTGHRAR
jgi:hypothetical protein